MKNLNQKELERLEKERKNIHLTIKTINIVIGVLITTIIFTLLKNTASLFDQKTFTTLFEKQQNTATQISTQTPKILIISSIALIILIYINQQLKKTIKEKIYKAIYNPKFKEKDINFDQKHGLTSEIMSSKLFRYANSYESNNLTEGKISDFPYKASNITLWKKRKKENGNTEKTIVFDGRMYIIKVPFYKKSIILRPKNNEKNPLNITILLTAALLIFTLIITVIIPEILSSNIASISSPDKTQISEEVINKTSQQNLKFVILFIGTVIALTLISLLFKLPSKRKYQEAKLESSQFNKYFYIETTDQIELRKTLTPAIIEKLINLRNSIGEFYLSIIGNRIFFAFPKPFDIKYDKPVQDLMKEAKESVEKEIETIKSIIETLKLEEEKIKKGIVNK